MNCNLSAIPTLENLRPENPKRKDNIPYRVWDWAKINLSEFIREVEDRQNDRLRNIQKNSRKIEHNFNRFYKNATQPENVNHRKYW